LILNENNQLEEQEGEMTTPDQYPVFVMSGSDSRRRKLLETVDPEGKYRTKALLPFLGKRLIEWQLEALRESPYVGGLYLIGLSEEEVDFDYPVHIVPCATRSDFADKLEAGLAYLEEMGELPEHVIISSCDAPGIRVEEINAFFEAVIAHADCEFIMGIVPEEVAEAVFPGSGRVVAHFKDCDVFPGELFALSPRAIRDNLAFIRAIGDRRRKINRHKRKIGMGPVLRYVARKPRTWLLLLSYALGWATLADAERVFSKAFNCKAKGVLIPDVGFGMDMDLPEDYERLKRFVRERKGVKEI
jgi:CTP:molybdopterin cytidylyltransferase MocA